jgi:NUMOD3 motif
MFINNKYYKWYNAIVDRSKNRLLKGYTEKHHILPKSLGGSNDISNIAILTAREHFICHRLLVLCLRGVDKQKMAYALLRLVHSSKRNISSKSYNHLKNNLEGFWKGKKHSAETRAKMSLVHTGVKHKKESKLKMSCSKKGKSVWPNGRVFTPEHRAKINASIRNRNSSV